MEEFDTAETEKQANLEYSISLSQVEISGVESHSPWFTPPLSTFSVNAERGSFFCPIFLFATGVLFSLRILPSDKDLLNNDL